MANYMAECVSTKDYLSKFVAKLDSSDPSIALSVPQIHVCYSSMYIDLEFFEFWRAQGDQENGEGD